MNRRDFFKTSALLGSGALLASVAPDRLEAAPKSRIKKYKEIGRTGIKMSDISFGAGKLPSSSMILRALDRGINYFDTAPDYGQSEKFIGQAISKRKGQRDKMIVATKFCDTLPYPGHLPLGSKKKDYVRAVESSLSRLKTDYVDFCFVHAIGEEKDPKAEEKRLFDPEMLAAADQLKKEGKIRFLAVSSHGPHSMEALMTKAVQSGHFQMVMMAFNFMKFPAIPRVLKEAKKNGVGVIAMKTLAGAKDMGLDPGGLSFEEAAFKWVLKHQEVDGLVVTMKSVRDFDRFLKASGRKYAAADERILEKYRHQYSEEYCRTGCGDCLPHCSKEINVASILRFQMYFEDYEMEKRAMMSYGALEKSADLCAGCDDVSCEAACPYHLPVASMMARAREQLSFTGRNGSGLG